MILDAGDKITLKWLEEKHAAQLLQLRNTNYDFLAEWLPWVPTMETEADFSAYIQRCRQKKYEGLEIPMVVFVKDQLAGRIGINYIDANRTGAIGYWIAEAFGGKGVITKACKAIIEYGFTEAGLNRIEIKCGTKNFRSQAIPERLGFTKEGMLRQGEFLNGAYIDLFLYSLLQEEWEASSYSK